MGVIFFKRYFDMFSKFKGVEFPEVNTVSRELTQKVLSRWAELGLE